MPDIQCLPRHVADLIAAGEVVERPASVAKELLENALDAGATAIVAEVQHGGLTYLRMTDNGCGIEKELLPHLFEGYLTRDQEEISDQRRNMGIGLSVCMSIVQAHGGTMRAENRKKGGALLQFSLPLEENSHEHQR